MTILVGADSATPQPSMYPARKIWGIYVAGSTPHVWTHDEVHALGAAGVLHAMPIVVPPQNEDWWSKDEGAEICVRLVAQARAWGLHVGNPLCLDIEEATAEKMGLFKIKVAARFVGACATYGYQPWTYGGELWHSATVLPGHGHRWLAKWKNIPITQTLVIPAGFNAWQHAGNVGGIDLDLFDARFTYMNTTTLEPLGV